MERGEKERWKEGKGEVERRGGKRDNECIKR